MKKKWKWILVLLKNLFKISKKKRIKSYLKGIQIPDFLMILQ